MKKTTSLSKTTDLRSTRDGYGQGLVKAGEKNQEVVVLTADLTESTRTTDFKKKFPERFFECGVAEQNMMGIAAGLALSGKIPFVSSFAVFSPGRNWEQLRISVCYSQANVKIVGSHGGITVGPDGASHQALEDLAITRVLPNLAVIIPCDFREAEKATLAAASYAGPVYLRLSREKTPVITKEEFSFEIGKSQVFREGKDITLIGCGPVLVQVLKAAEILAEKEKIEAEVINCPTIKPLDKTTILTSLKKTSKVVSIEDHQVIGGLGSAIAELLVEELPLPMLRLGMPDIFGESGTDKELLAKYNLDSQGIANRIKERFL